MTTICKNCNQYFEGNYCNNCGQSAETNKINFHFLWHDIQHGFFHFDKGLLFTAKKLFSQPGNSIREFIEGKRVKHFKPISLVLVLAGICGFLYHFFHINILADNIEVSGSGKEVIHLRNVSEKVTEWIAEHYAIVSIAELPAFAISTFIAFKKTGYNFMEHLVLNAFLTGQRLILHLITFPLYYIYNGTPILKIIERNVDVIGIGLMVWALIQFFNKQKKTKAFLHAMLSLLIFFLIAFAILSGLVKIIIASET